jgi:hypothetical protein
MNVRSATIIAITLSIGLTGCDLPTANGAGKLGPFNIVQAGRDGAIPGTCWGNRVTPAIIETVERDFLVQPAQVSTDGRIQQPAIYRKERRQEIVQERQEVWTEIVCPIAMNQDFTASLQRALAVRGYFRGEATGLIDKRTTQAIRKFQSEDGFDEPTLTVASARKLGLIAVPRDPN